MAPLSHVSLDTLTAQEEKNKNCQYIKEVHNRLFNGLREIFFGVLLCWC